MSIDFFAFLLWLLFTQCIFAQTECDWVRIIYRKMGGSALISLECCKMHGVICNDDGRVTGINWSHHGLTGDIPPEIGKLVNLEEL